MSGPGGSCTRTCARSYASVLDTAAWPCCSLVRGCPGRDPGGRCSMGSMYVHDTTSGQFCVRTLLTSVSLAGNLVRTYTGRVAMPKQDTTGHTPHRQVRMDEATWQRLGAVAAERGTDRSAIIRDLVRWWLREPGARMPGRVADPPPSEDDSA